MSNKYESAIKEKMLMKLEKDRLAAKVENLESSLAQVKDDAGGPGDESQFNLKASPTKTNASSKAGGSPAGKYSSAGALTHLLYVSWPILDPHLEMANPTMPNEDAVSSAAIRRLRCSYSAIRSQVRSRVKG